jgi:hypothetical protein
MNESREELVIPRPGRLRRFLRWWIIGRWWAKPLKAFLAVLLVYNILAFLLMWCPPVKGVVVDISTGKPIEGAIVQKAAGGPFIFPSLWPGGAHTGGAFSQTVTDKSGRFSFPGAFAHPTPSEYSWFMVLWPFQWVDRVDLRAWDKNYVGVLCAKRGLWWLRDRPNRSEGVCEVRRYRLPILGFYYQILLKQPMTEKEWVVKIGSVSLDLNGQGSAEQGRLFSDLTGYLERWPEGEKAGEFIIQLADLGMAVSATVAETDQLGRASATELQTKAESLKTILHFIGSQPVSGKATAPILNRDLSSEIEIIEAGIAKIEQELYSRNGRQHAR